MSSKRAMLLYRTYFVVFRRTFRPLPSLRFATSDGTHLAYFVFVPSPISLFPSVFFFLISFYSPFEGHNSWSAQRPEYYCHQTAVIYAGLPSFSFLGVQRPLVDTYLFARFFCFFFFFASLVLVASVFAWLVPHFPCCCILPPWIYGASPTAASHTHIIHSSDLR